MIALLDYDDNNLNIPVITPWSFNDRVDGIADTLTISFMSNSDLMQTYNKYQKCRMKIYNNEELLKEYRMVVTDINRALNTTYSNNSSYTYYYTMTLSEPSVFLQNCVKTDIKITPFAYPQVIEEETGRYPYRTLWDAYYKVLSCHNLVTRNEKVYGGFDTLFRSEINLAQNGDLENVVTVNVSSLRNIETLTINGVMKLDNEEKEINLSYSDLPATVSLQTTITIGGATITFDSSTVISLNEETDRLVFTTSSISSVPFSGAIYTTFEGTLKSILNIKEVKLKDLLESVPCPTLTYKDLNTFSQLQDIFDRVGLVPYLDFYWDNKHCFIDFYYKEGNFDSTIGIQELDINCGEEVSKVDDSTSEAVTSLVNNMVMDTDLMVFPSRFTNYLITSNFPDNVLIPIDQDALQFLNGTSTFNGDLTSQINIGFLNNYNASAESIKGPQEYYLQLPTNIENIEGIYYCFLALTFAGDRQLAFIKVKENLPIEYSEWKQLTTLQQKKFSYFVRGENNIKQAICLTSATDADLQGDYKWSDTNLYNVLKRYGYIVIYKPMLDETFTKYNEETKNSTTTKTINMPFKVSSDKQVTNVLSYELAKRNSNVISFKSVTNDISILNHYAGEKVYFKKTKLTQDNFIGNYTSYLLLNNVVTTNFTDNTWATIGNTVYKFNTTSNRWFIYKGDVCVITKINFTINRNSIDCTFELSDKIATDNSYSGYSDNVRVSDNLSTEGSVYRDVSMYKTINVSAYNRFPDENLLYWNIGSNPNAFPNINANDGSLFGIGLWNNGFKLPDTLIINGTDYRQQVAGRNNNLNLYQFGIKQYYPQLLESTSLEIVNSNTTTYRYYVDDNKLKLRITTSDDTYFYTFAEIDFSTPKKVAIGQLEQELHAPPVGINITTSNVSTISSINELNEYLLANGEVGKIYTTTNSVLGITINHNSNVLLICETDEDFDDLKSGRTGTAISDFVSTDYCLLRNENYNVLYIMQAERTEYTVHSNPTWISSNLIENCNFSFPSTCVVGNIMHVNEEDPVVCVPSQSNPLFYTKSTVISTLDNIGNYQLPESFGTNGFKEYLEQFGYSDVKIDIGEILLPHIQYNIIKETNKDYINHNHIYIKELNSNLSYTSNIYPIATNYTDTRQTYAKIYRLPVGYTINDYMLNKDLATDVYNPAYGATINKYDIQIGITNNPDYNQYLQMFGEIITTGIGNDFNNNYLITIVKNNIETPFILLNGYQPHPLITNICIGARID